MRVAREPTLADERGSGGSLGSRAVGSSSGAQRRGRGKTCPPHWAVGRLGMGRATGMLGA